MLTDAKSAGALTTGCAMRPITTHDVVSEALDRSIRKIEDALDGTGVAFVGPLGNGVDDILRGLVDSIKTKKDRLIVILETPGGYAEVTQRIADNVFRKHFKIIDYIVPNYAMSAGTILVMSGDAIYMDDYSMLGPIDPQVEKKGRMVPALGYLRRYEDLLKKAQSGSITLAEVQILVDGFDQAELYMYEQAEKLSHKLLTDWLVKYKFKDWNETKTKKIKVDAAMKASRAEEIAKKLSDTSTWHSHGRGIMMATLVNDINLVIDDFGANKALNGAVKTYYKLLRDYMNTHQLMSAAHTRGQFLPISRGQ
jgi:hypothetical protein